MENKYQPVEEREYIVTDTCMYDPDAGDEYNPLDTERAPHILQCVDRESGTVVHLKSGSVIKVIKANE